MHSFRIAGVNIQKDFDTESISPVFLQKKAQKGAELEKTYKLTPFLVAYLRNISYLCNRNRIEMEQTVFELDLLEEARDFLKSLTKEIRGKIGYNIRRVQKGEPKESENCILRIKTRRYEKGRRHEAV